MTGNAKKVGSLARAEGPPCSDILSQIHTRRRYEERWRSGRADSRAQSRVREGPAPSHRNRPPCMLFFIRKIYILRF
jgi:hypothetical protein